MTTGHRNGEALVWPSGYFTPSPFAAFSLWPVAMYLGFAPATWTWENRRGRAQPQRCHEMSPGPGVPRKLEKWLRNLERQNDWNQIHQINPNQPQISHLIVNHGDLVPSDDSGETFLGPWPLHPRCPGQIVVTETPSSWRRWGPWFLFFTR